MLEFILSRKPTAFIKTIYGAVSSAADTGEVVIFTPDQFSFKMEKLVYEQFERSRLLNIRVTTPARFSAELLKKHGMNRRYADDAVKYAVMYRAFSELKNSGTDCLCVYGNKRLASEPVDFFLGMVRTMKQAGLSPDGLRRLLNAENELPEALADKLSDILLIYSSYDAALKRDFEDKLDDILRAEKIIRAEKRFSDTRCFFVGFDAFSGNQMVFLKAIIETAVSASFFLTTDAPQSDKPEFYCINSIIAQLSSFSEEKPTFTSSDGENPPALIPDAAHCEIVRCGDIWQEASYIAARIRRLVIDYGYRYRDILVLSRGGCGSVMKSAAGVYDIPIFADIPSSIADKPLIKFIVAVLGALSFESDDIMSYVKSGFVRIENADGEKRLLELGQISELEKFVRAYGVNKRDWLSPFPDALTAKYGGGESNPEYVRERVIAPLKRLGAVTENTTADAITERLCDFLFSEACIDGSIYGICKFGGEKGSDELVLNEKKASEYRRIWDMAADIFESLHDALKGCKMSVREYRRVLYDIFRKTNTANPPEVLDAVTCGDLERTRTDGAKIVFISGFNDGVIPAPLKPSNGFSGRENEVLSEHGIAVGENRKTRSSRERFLAYKAMTLTDGAVTITFPLLDESFSEKQPSAYIAETAERLGIEITDAETLGAEFYCSTERATEQFAYSHYGSSRAAALTALEALGSKNVLARIEAILRMQSFEAYRHTLESDTAEKLFTRESYSPSAIESAMSCRFAHFCKYGLGLFDEPEKEISPVQLGNAMHFALKAMLEEYRGRYDELAVTDTDELKLRLKKAFSEYEETEYPSGIGTTKRFSYVLAELSSTAVVMLKYMSEGMNEHGFIPEAFEHEVSYAPDGICIKGRFDRFDSHIGANGEKYIRVIDYKSGGKTMPLESVFYGKNLQMLLYLFALCGDGAKPSGVGYIAAGGIEKAKTTRLGLEADEIKGIRERCAEKYKQTGVSVEGNIPDRDCKNILSEEDFTRLKNYCEKYVINEMNALKSGQIDALPVVEMKKRADEVAKAPCDYCGFSSFCGNSALNNYIAIKADRMNEVIGKKD